MKTLSQTSKPLQKSNLDSTGRAIVKRGCVVQFPGGATARVARVRAGNFFPETCKCMTACDFVRVIA